MNKKVVSIIDIGSSSIKMKIYELKENEYKILEDVRQHVTLGNDTFYDGAISRKTITDCIAILNRYKRLSSDYNAKEIKAFATTAVREATNADIFLDNVYRETNIEITLLESENEREFIYRSIIEFLTKLNFDFSNKKFGILEIGAGNLNLLLIEEKCVIYSKSLPLGILKTQQQFRKMYKYSEENYLIFLESILKSELKNITRDLPLNEVDDLFIIAAEITQLPFLKNELGKISKIRLKTLYKKIKNYSLEDLTKKLKIPYDLANSFIPAFVISNEFVDFLKCKEILIPKVSLTDGILYQLYFAHEEKDYFVKLEKQLLINSLQIGRSLNFDEKHALKVLDFALKIFDATKHLHLLGNIEKCYLLCAAILHDIGTSISYRSHHKHSLYIIKYLNFFSLNKNQINIIANIARYHRKSPPKTSHIDYMNLRLYDRITVLKLASILRIADSLDNSHQQKIEDISIEELNSQLVIKIKTEKDFFSELFSFEYKKRLFEDFFGIKVEIKKYHK